MASAHYDLIVLGDDFAGLVAASLCASRGMRVLLAETSTRRDSYKLGDESLPLAPLAISGLESPYVRRVIEELHFQHLLKRRLEVLQPPCQLLLPDLRLEAHADRLRFSKGLRRELQSDSSWLLDAEEAQAPFDALCETEACVPPTGFWERRELGKLTEACHGASEAWRDAEHLPACESLAELPLYAALGRVPGSALSRARILAAARQGVTRVEGDWEAWRSIFIEKFKSHNGELRRIIPQELQQSWGKVTGLVAVDDSFSCDYLIAALPVHELLPLFGKKPPKRLVELGEDVHPIGYRYTLNLILSMTGLPEGMSKLAWSLLDPGEPATGGNFASFSTRPAARSGRAVVTMQGLTELDAEGGPRLDGLRDALLDHARTIMPFLDSHLETVDSPHEAVSPGKERDLDDAIPLRAIWECPPDETLGLQALPYGAGPKHICIASEQSLPELGMEGQLIAGWSAAKLATLSMGKGSKRRSGSAKTSVLAESR